MTILPVERASVTAPMSSPICYKASWSESSADVAWINPVAWQVKTKEADRLTASVVLKYHWLALNSA